MLQAMLFRTVDDAKALAVTGSRVRLVKGAYDEPAEIAHRTKKDVDAAYARCLEILMTGPGYPMVSSHDPAMIRLAHELADAGTCVRAYVPYGVDWYGYFMRRLAERPANVGFFLRSLATRS